MQLQNEPGVKVRNLHSELRRETDNAIAWIQSMSASKSYLDLFPAKVTNALDAFRLRPRDHETL